MNFEISCQAEYQPQLLVPFPHCPSERIKIVWPGHSNHLPPLWTARFPPTHTTYFPLPHSAGRTVQAPGTCKRLQMLFPKPGISFPSLHTGGPSSKTQMSPCPPQCLSVPKADWLLLLCAPEAASHHHADITSLCSGTLCPLQRRPPKTVSQSRVQDLLSTSWGWGTDWIDPSSLMALQVIFTLASSLQYAKCCTLSCVGCTGPSGKSTVGTEYRN